MNDDLKIALVVCLAIVLVAALVVGGVIGFRALKQTDPRGAVTDFSVTVNVSPDYVCKGFMIDEAYMVTCTERR